MTTSYDGNFAIRVAYKTDRDRRSKLLPDEFSLPRDLNIFNSHTRSKYVVKSRRTHRDLFFFFAVQDGKNQWKFKYNALGRI